MCSARSDRPRAATLSARASLALALFCSVVLAGCALNAPASGAGTAAELTDTPFFPQRRYQCGPAALSTVLEYSGVATDMDTLVQQVYLPGERGSLQAELLAATRRAGRIPWRLDATPAALLAELRAGRPVLVLQNLGVGWWPRWHYAVVIGVEDDAVILRSGAERRRQTRRRTFFATWQRAGNWAFVALAPDELPAEPDRQRFFRTLSELEATGHFATAGIAWQRALSEWPGSQVALFGLANSQYGRGLWSEAEGSYRRLLEVEPRLAAARNNLALTLLELDRFEEAEVEAEQALAAAADDANLARSVRDTLERIRDSRRQDQSRSGRPSSTSR